MFEVFSVRGLKLFLGEIKDLSTHKNHYLVLEERGVLSRLQKLPLVGGQQSLQKVGKERQEKRMKRMEKVCFCEHFIWEKTMCVLFF